MEISLKGSSYQSLDVVSVHVSNGYEYELRQDITLVLELKDCAKRKDHCQGSKLHALVIKRGLLAINIYIGSALVNMYAKCSALARAQEVFDQLPSPSIAAWNALISGYSEQGHGEKALYCFDQMKQQGFSPNAGTFALILKACSSVGEVEKGKEMHDEIVRKEFLGRRVELGTALVDMFAKCGALAKAQQIFDEILQRDVISWNALILAYTHNGFGEKALDCFKRMKSEGVTPSEVTFACVLKACGIAGAIEKGEELHDMIVKEGLLDRNCVIGSALVEMYAKCGALSKARMLFDELSAQDVVAWTALITGYCQHGHGEEALNCYEQLQQEGHSPNAVTLLCILQACGIIGEADKVQYIQDRIVKAGMLEKSCALGNTLVDKYVKCGSLARALQVFNKLPVRDKVSWTALITGYCQHGHGEEAMTWCSRMQQEGLSPDPFTLACTLQACGGIGAVEKGQGIHADIVRGGLLGDDNVLGTALVSMYAKCSALAKARQAFDELPDRSVVSWNSLIGGYLQVGKHNLVFELLNNMLGEGIQPDMVTFIVTLKACSHIGLLHVGQMYFEAMSARYGILPTLDHHTCLVDLLGHAGQFNEAMTVIEKMPLPDYLPAWFSLLGSCRKWGNVKVGRLAFDNVVRLDKESAVAYVCMREIYASAGMQEAACKVEAVRQSICHDS